MRFPERITLALWKDEDEAKLREETVKHESVFERAIPEEGRLPRCALAIAGVSCVLLISVALTIALLPPEAWPEVSSTPPPKPNNTIGHSATLSCGPFCSVNLAQCKVACGGITEEYPGKCVAEFLADIHVDNDICSSWILLVTNTRFPDATLNSSWLDSGGRELPNIRHLELISLNLSKIERGAFSTSPALGANLKDLSIHGNPELKEINADTTLGLTELTRFEWFDNHVLTDVTSDALLPFFSTLETLHISGGIKSPSMVANLVGSCSNQNLSSLQTVNFGHNTETDGLKVLDSKLFSRLSQVTQFFLGNSSIQSLANSDVFKPMARTLQLLHLGNNKLNTLPEGTFDETFSPRFTVYLNGNSWRCDEDLQWFQEKIRNNELIVEGDPKCGCPESEKNKTLMDANMTNSGCPSMTTPPLLTIFCNISPTTPSPTPITTEFASTTNIFPTYESSSFGSPTETTTSAQSTTPNKESVIVTQCNASTSPLSRSRRHSTIVFFPKAALTVKELSDRTTMSEVIVTISSKNKSGMLLWTRPDKSEGCWWESNHRVVTIKNLERNQPYTFCLLEGPVGEESLMSPLQCIALHTKLHFSKQTWLPNGLKSTVIPVSTVILLIIAIVGVGATVFIFARRPPLLSICSSRVVVVKKLSDDFDVLIEPTRKQPFTTEQDAPSVPPRERNNSSLTTVPPVPPREHGSLSLISIIDKRLNTNSEVISDISSGYISIIQSSKLRSYLFRFKEWCRRTISGKWHREDLTASNNCFYHDPYGPFTRYLQDLQAVPNHMRY